MPDLYPPVPSDDLSARLEAVESRLAIGQLPIRYALAVDGRDLDAWVALFVPTVQVGRASFGRDALRAQIEPALRTFGRSIHQICGHLIELDPSTPDRATGEVYCRAEHEVEDRWIVMAICYSDEYERGRRRVVLPAAPGAPLVRRRRERTAAVGRLRQLAQRPGARAPRRLPHLGPLLDVTPGAVNGRR